MAEVGIDVAGRTPRLRDYSTRELAEQTDDGLRQCLPLHTGKRYVDWELPDPPDTRSPRYAPPVTR